ncbi:MAG TPA: DUF1345 domain-containing protein [Albitalea sp.]|nr:DUF1345 domain-containing protein [Albitalea sp.]
MANHLRARPRMVIAALVGAAAGAGYPAASLVTRTLVGWNVGVWLYLLLIAMSMFRADHARLRKAALAHAEGALTVSVVVIAAALASLAAIVLELAAAKAARAAGAPHAAPQIALTLVTVTGSWLVMPVLFMLNYATVYYSDDRGQGLRFPPDTDAEPRPSYADFAYFSFTIAVALQTADVAITTTRMRQLVLAQSVLSFVFNTAILAFLVNIAASLF